MARTEQHGRGDRPRVAFVGTASGDADGYVTRFEEAFSDRAETSVVSLFWRDGSDLTATLLDQDAVFVGGGSTLNLLTLWRLHGLDATVQTRRLAGMLARKGYPSDVSMRVIREAIAGTPEHQRD